MTTPATTTGIEVHTTFFPLAFFLFACTPRIEVDGQVHQKYWGRHFFPTPPGRHTVRVWFRYLVMARCGENQITVDVPATGAVRVKYNMPPLVTLKGSLKVV